MARKHWWGFDPNNEGDWGTAACWSPSGVPGAGDEIIIGPGSSPITGTLDQSGVALGDVWILEGYDERIGVYGDGDSTPINLQIDCDRLEIAGSGKQYIQLENSGAIDVIVERAEQSTLSGKAGLYLTTDGTRTVGLLSVRSGVVHVAHFGDDPSQTVAEVVLNGPQAKVTIGEAVTATAVTVEAGVCRWLSGNTTGTFTVSGSGVAFLLGSGAVTELRTAGKGLANLGGTGTITAITLDGRDSVVDGTWLAATQTITGITVLSGGKYHGNASYRTVSGVNDRTDNVSYTMSFEEKV